MPLKNKFSSKLKLNLLIEGKKKKNTYWILCQVKIFKLEKLMPNLLIKILC